ncbi:hypothetical protein PPL_02049 [Heterostelium album PN500]|uniref:CMP/dCMP-type deaminase domain-containing protein n=1 Tax=Heterostelium pallidum (strain ATCC 26659 / Pp 5 / PN500) TaxID=670386 RepID=D3B179_HETP5|nr:hypothetical protein PPL_02049 [Heterostelium album PN500]EFA85053.1 hypothetical protein PPL_02049 [Heterostelium album PN500]|eukprot:XP_020437163.1 hypothetical protein PPL_02049 [Heterostelium album PN500]
MSKFILSCVLVIFAVSLACDDPFIEFPRPTRVLQPEDLSLAHRQYHEKYMQIAYDLAVAKKSIFTTVIVAPNGTVACTGLNQNEKSAIYHGEIVAILNCSAIYNKNTWEGYSLYTTGESCAMCQAAAMWAGFDQIIYGTSIETLYCEKCLGQLPVLSNQINALAYGLSGNNSPAQIIGGILARKTDTLFPNYFINQNEIPIISSSIIDYSKENYGILYQIQTMILVLILQLADE